jgi:hypothetical protein
MKKGHSKILDKTRLILLNALPIVLMIGLIWFVADDYLLTSIFFLIIVSSFIVKYEKGEWIYLALGLIAMTIAEAFFVSTGVEKFTRTTLFNMMPIWLPVLWAYAFVAIKRGIVVLRK